MSYRRIATITAVLAAGAAALVPALAFAGDAPHAAARGANLSHSPLTAGKFAGSKTFTSSGSRSVFTPKSARHERRGGRGEPDPHRHRQSAYSFSISGAVVTAGTPVSASVDWGDTTTGSGTISGTTVTASHTYEKLGTYTVTVTVTDDQSNTVVNTVTADDRGFGLHGLWPDPRA